MRWPALALPLLLVPGRGVGLVPLWAAGLVLWKVALSVAVVEVVSGVGAAEIAQSVAYTQLVALGQWRLGAVALVEVLVSGGMGSRPIPKVGCPRVLLVVRRPRDQ